MTNCTENIRIQPISFSNSQLMKIKASIAISPWGILLDSATTENKDCRWSIFTAQPIATLESLAGTTTIHEDCGISKHSSDPLQLMQTLRKKLFHEHNIDHDIPFTGGALGYLSYELGYRYEKIKNAQKPSGLELPEMAIGFYDWALLLDHEKMKLFLMVHCNKSNEIEGESDLHSMWQQRFDWLKSCYTSSSVTSNFNLTSAWQANMNKAQYTQKFAKIQQYILDGDCYQVNLAQRFQASYVGDEYQAYQALLAYNRPPFAAFLRLPGQVILSLSPERFLKLNNNNVETKPIKGTRPRFNDSTEDNNSKQTLFTSEKDRAENLMIVDLLRNDIGRVCKAGSVTVPKLFDIESYPAVHHLVSTVLGKLEDKHNTEDLFRACFPGGSITGAPKIRAMEIIAELEPHQRQIYCGSIGYINADGNTDTNIAIRTLLCFEQNIYCWAGGGLVADSNVDDEYQECFDKVSKILPCLESLNK